MYCKMQMMRVISIYLFGTSWPRLTGKREMSRRFKIVLKGAQRKILGHCRVSTYTHIKMDMRKRYKIGLKHAKRELVRWKLPIIRGRIGKNSKILGEGSEREQKTIGRNKRTAKYWEKDWKKNCRQLENIKEQKNIARRIRKKTTDYLKKPRNTKILGEG